MVNPRDTTGNADRRRRVVNPRDIAGDAEEEEEEEEEKEEELSWTTKSSAKGRQRN